MLTSSFSGILAVFCLLEDKLLRNPKISQNAVGKPLPWSSTFFYVTTPIKYESGDPQQIPPLSGTRSAHPALACPLFPTSCIFIKAL